MSFSNFIEWSIHNVGSYPERKVFFFREVNCIQIKKYHTFRSLPPNTKFLTLPPCRSQGCLKGCLTGFWGGAVEVDVTPCQQRTGGTCHTPDLVLSPHALWLHVPQHILQQVILKISNVCVNFSCKYIIKLF